MAAAFAIPGAGSTVMRLTLDATVTALVEISLEAAKFRCHMDSTITGAVPMITVERIVGVTT